MAVMRVWDVVMIKRARYTNALKLYFYLYLSLLHALFYFSFVRVVASSSYLCYQQVSTNRIFVRIAT
jgi:hypothetical protein